MVGVNDSARPPVVWLRTYRSDDGALADDVLALDDNTVAFLDVGAQNKLDGIRVRRQPLGYL